jgi:hypothetical protein
MEKSSDPKRLLRRVVDAIETCESERLFKRGTHMLKHLPTGESHIHEAAWRETEEIARIADDMFLPPSVEEHLARLKQTRKDT